jgi:hypothetical protein
MKARYCKASDIIKLPPPLFSTLYCFSYVKVIEQSQRYKPDFAGIRKAKDASDAAKAGAVGLRYRTLGVSRDI